MTDDLKIELMHDSQISQSDNFINFKVIIIGDSGVGKSSILKRAVKNTFDQGYQATIGFEFLLMHFKVNDLKIKLQIWDTCGQEMYRSLVQGFYHNSSLAIIVYDINVKESFQNADIWLKDLKQHTEQELPVFLVGNKYDLEKNVPTNEANNFYKNNNLSYFAECSAKSGYNVQEIFYEAARQLYHIYNKLKSENKFPVKASKLKIDKNDDNKNSNQNNKKRNCCK